MKSAHSPTTTPSKTANHAAKTDQRNRLAAALKANLKRRKAAGDKK